MISNSPFTFSDPKLVAGLYSSPSFRALCKPDFESNDLICNLKNLLNHNAKGQTLGTILGQGFEVLLENYRHEYLFKSALFKDFILENYALDSSILLSEFKIGRSIADAVLVNGSNKVFEIKTELDSPIRLNSQLSDYKKAFSEIFVVVHENQVEKYAKLISDEIGILIFKETVGFSEYRKPSMDLTKLEIAAMAKSLRKEELLALVTNLTGEIPVATPVKLFRTCLELAENFTPDQVQKEYLQIIKKRISPQVNAKVLSDKTPSYLKFFCYTEKIKEKEYIHLLNSLELTF